MPLAPNDVKEQLASLIYPGFASRTPHCWLIHLPRFVKAADVRLKKLFNAGAARDSINLAIVRPLWEQYLRRRDVQKKQNIYDPELTEYRWMLEEFRVSLFAQELKTSMTISPQRLEAQWMKTRVYDSEGTGYQPVSWNIERRHGLVARATFISRST